MAEVTITIFQTMLEKKLFPNNDFTRYSKNGGQPNVDVAVIPQSTGGNEPIIGGVNSGYYDHANNLANATELTPVIRVNNRKQYSNVIVRLPEPYVYETLQDVVLSYSKASEISSEEADNMNTAVANYLAIQWTPTLATNIFPTTGLDRSGTEQKRDSAVATGGYSGLVKRFAYADLKNANLQIAKTNVTGGQWVALPTPELWEDLLSIPEIVDYEMTGNETMLKKGMVGSWGKIKFLDPRQNDRWNANVLYDITVPATPVVVAYGGALNANCVSALLIWNDKQVEKNEGALNFFSRRKDPIFMGDIVNWGVRTGGSSRRLDEKGVLAFYEAPTI